jgi:phosphate starvation-inducible PhoH-like protein
MSESHVSPTGEPGTRSRHATRRDFSLLPEDAHRLANLAGPLDEHLRQIEARLGVEIANRANLFRISGEAEAAASAESLLRSLYADAELEPLDRHKIHLRMNAANVDRLRAAPAAAGAGDDGIEPQEVSIRVKRGFVRGRGANQARYLHAIATHDINFGIGPAGTGKTFLAVASAVEALNESRVQRLLLVRPAVEAGEKLGFLPGDLSQKVDPYLRPLYDALYDLMGYDKVTRSFERGAIEIAPLAFMRGRTLNHSFVILDEAQNTTPEQMKMFLTRIGFGSRAVITGDVSQVDLPRGSTSGLVDAERVLDGVRGIAFSRFTAADVVRHPLVARIVEAYDAAKAKPQ